MNKLTYIETKTKKYPIAFNINVMEEIQEAYGSMDAWAKIVENSEGGEPKIKDLKVGLMMMINEAIDIENETSENKESFVDSKKVGRIVSEIGFKEITNKIKELTIASTNSGDNGQSKNE